MQKWTLLRKGADFQAIAAEFGISPRVACLIRNRDVIGSEQIEKYLHGGVKDLYDGMLLKDMDQAVKILKEKIEGKKKIRVIGDYDIDGVNATYILLEGIERLGGMVDYDIPDRMKDGYGLNVDLIRRASEAEVDTVITCDNGIAAKDAIRYAKELGMTVIVTDHHEVPYEEVDGKRIYQLPEADAVIDPKQEDCSYPFSGICGATVSYKVIVCLYRYMDRDPREVDDLLENAAVATVGDVMDLVDENRILVKEGLKRLRDTKNPGYRALIDVNHLQSHALMPYHLGFVIGPCLNATGRLDSAKRALELLRAADKKQADILAGDLKAFNDSRKELTLQAVEQAEELVESTDIGRDRVLVIYLPDCHESIAGIVAGRIRERYYKPVFVVTDAEHGLKGSGRSIEGYHMYDEMNKCREYLTKFGGHALAAGFSLERENLEGFRKVLNEYCRLTEEDLTEKIAIDMELPFSAVTESFTEELEILEPFGKGNTKPVFAARGVTVRNPRVMGKDRNVVKMLATDRFGETVDAIYFGNAEEFVQAIHPEMLFTFYPKINVYNGRKSMQIVISQYR